MQWLGKRILKASLNCSFVYSTCKTYYIHTTGNIKAWGDFNRTKIQELMFLNSTYVLGRVQDQGTAYSWQEIDFISWMLFYCCLFNKLDCGSLFNMAVRISLLSGSTCLILVAVATFLLKYRNKSQSMHSGIIQREIVGSYDSKYNEYFPKHYHASGLLILPYDKIVEPFEAWFAGDQNMSRIDYYYGMINHIYTKIYSYVFPLISCHFKRWVISITIN